FIRVYLTALALASEVGAGTPEEAKDSAQQELATAKQNAVRVIGYRNKLRDQLQQQQNRASHLERNMRTAFHQSNEELAKQVLGEKEIVDHTIVQITQLMEQAEENALVVKQSIRDLEARVRQQRAERILRDLQAEAETYADLTMGSAERQITASASDADR